MCVQVLNWARTFKFWLKFEEKQIFIDAKDLKLFLRLLSLNLIGSGDLKRPKKLFIMTPMQIRALQNIVPHNADQVMPMILTQV